MEQQMGVIIIRKKCEIIVHYRSQTVVNASFNLHVAMKH